MSPAEHRIDAVKGICKELFPLVARAITSTEIGSLVRGEWRSERRICSEDMFDRYFLLGVPAGDLSRAELDSLLEIAEAPNELVTALREYSKTGRFIRLTDWLPDLVPRLTKQGVMGFCEAALTAIDEFTDERRNKETWGWRNRLAGTVVDALRKLPENERCDWLHTQVTSGKHLGALVNQVAREEKIRGRRPSYALLSDECQERLQRACVTEMRAKAKTGELRSIRNLPGNLAAWKRWSDMPSEVDDYVRGALSTPRGILDFVSDCLYEIHWLAGPDGPAHVKWSLSVDALGELTDLQALEHALRDAAASVGVLSERQQLAVGVFESEMSVRGSQNASPSAPPDG